MKLYKQLKNHIHNTLGITKDEIREMVVEVVRPIVERKVDVVVKEHFGTYELKRLIDDAIEAQSVYWLDNADLDSYIKRAVVDKLVEGIGLKVEIAKTKKEATSGFTKAKILVPVKRKK